MANPMPRHPRTAVQRITEQLAAVRKELVDGWPSRSRRRELADREQQLLQEKQLLSQ